MAPGDEWLTTRDLRLRLLGNTEPLPAEFLSDEVIEGNRRISISKGIRK